MFPYTHRSRYVVSIKKRIELKFPHDIPLVLILIIQSLAMWFHHDQIVHFFTIHAHFILIAILTSWYRKNGSKLKREESRKKFMEQFWLKNSIVCIFIAYFYSSSTFASLSLNLNKNQIEGGDVEDIDVNNSETMSIT